MARWCATFDNTNTPVATLLTVTNGNRFQRVAFPGSPGGTARRNTLISTRQGLSDAFYAQIDAANRNGANGVVVPRDALVDNGVTISGSNLYTNAGAIWPENPRTRPSSEILIAGSTVVSPADAWSIDRTLYANAQAAVEAVIADLGVRNRLGNNPYRTLASFWHDHDLTFVAWDDFTPGQPTTNPTRPAPNRPVNAPITITIPWSITQFPADLEGNVRITALLSRNGGGSSTSLTNQIVSAQNLSFDWVIPANTLTAGTYTLDLSVWIRDATITTSEGVPGSFTDNAFLTTV